MSFLYNEHDKRTTHAIKNEKGGFIMSAQDYAARAGLTVEEWKKATRFRGVDFGWVIMNIGLAIGAGTVFLPLQVGLVGIWVFILAAIVGYPILYQFQKLYVDVLVESPKCEDFAGVISGYLGRGAGLLLGALYFVMMTILIFLYSTALTNDSASFLQTFGVTQGLLSQNIFYGLAIICFMVAIASQGEKLLFKVSSAMVMTKLCVIALLGLVMVQYWNLANIPAFPAVGYMVKQSIILLPLVGLSITYLGSLSPLVIFYRNHTENKEVAHYLSLRASNIAYVVLLVVVLFLAFSFNLAISHDQSVLAYKSNISTLAIAAKNMDGSLVKILSLILNIFAIATAYFSAFLGFRDSCKGIAANILQRFIPEDHINEKAIKYGTSLFCIASCWGVIILNAPILALANILGPAMGIIGCLLPVFLVYKMPEFKKYRGWSCYTISVMGVLLVISPFLTLH